MVNQRFFQERKLMKKRLPGLFLAFVIIVIQSEGLFAFDSKYMEELSDHHQIHELQQYLDNTDFNTLSNDDKQEFLLRSAEIKIMNGKILEVMNLADQVDKLNNETGNKNSVRANFIRILVYKLLQQDQKASELIDKTEQDCLINNLEEQQADLNYLKGYFLIASNKNNESIEFLKKASEVYKKLKKQKKLLEVQIYLSSSLISLSQLEEAERLLNETKETNNTLDNPLIEAKINLNLTIIYFTQGNLEKALNCIEKTINYSSTSSNKLLLAEANIWKAIILTTRGQDKQAEPLYLGSIDIFKQNAGENQFLSGMGYYYLSLVYGRQSDYNQALIMAQKAYEVFKKLYNDENPYTANALNQLAEINNKLGNYEKAEEIYKKSISISEKLYGKESINNVSPYFNLASIYYNESRFYEALELYKKDLYLMNKFAPENHPFYSKIYDNIAVCLLNLKNYKEALLYQQKALNLYIRESAGAENNLKIAIAYSHLANIYYNLHQLDNMKNAGVKSIKIIEDNNLSNNLSAAFIYDQLSSLYNLGELYDASLDCLEKSLSIKKQYLPENHRQLAGTYNLIGNTYDSLKEYREAIQFYQEAANIFKRNNDYYYLWQSYSNLGYTNQKQGKYKEALVYYDKSLSTLDLIINDSTIKEDKYFLSEQKRLIIENAIKSSLKLNLPTRALFYSEKARYQDLLSDIARKKALLLTSINQTDRQKLEELENSLVKYEKLCPGNALSVKNIKTESLNSLGIDYNTECEEKIRVKKTFDDYIMRLSRKYSVLNRKLNNPLTSEKELKNLINSKSMAGKAIIEYMVGFDTLYTFVVFNGEVTVIQNEIYQDELEKHIREYNKPFRLVSLAQTNGVMLEILKKYNTKTSYDLYQLLLEEAITRLKTYTAFSSDINVILIPDESLNYLSFETLITNLDVKIKESDDIALSGYEELPYFIKEYTVNYLPNIAISTFILPVNPINKESDDKFLIIGNPDMTYTKESNPEIKNLGELPFSENEAVLIHGIFKNNSALITGKQATEKKVSSLLGQYQNYHFACHGLINEDEPLKSGIVLAREEQSSQKEQKEGFDGILRTYEILMKNVNANLVVLSACESGSGKLNSGEGVLGVARSFLVSGTNAMVISLWKINDESSSLLMSEFYKNMAKMKNQQASNALREAQISFMKTKNTHFTCGKYKGLSFSHPYFWGAFIYTGI